MPSGFGFRAKIAAKSFTRFVDALAVCNEAIAFIVRAILLRHFHKPPFNRICVTGRFCRRIHFLLPGLVCRPSSTFCFASSVL
jgi:hypothetical protein